MISKKALKTPLSVHLVAFWVIIACSQTSLVDIHQLSAMEARALIENNTGKPEFVIMDVRTLKEFKQGHIAGAFLLDYHSPDFIQGLQRLDKSKTYLIYCRTGNRSGRALKIIKEMNFSTIYHMKHGITEWRAKRLPIVKKP